VKERLVRAFSASLATAAAALLLVPAASSGDGARVLAIEFDNDVNPVTADYVVNQLERAKDDGFDAAVIVLDTPGGLSDSMREIYQAELDLRIPVIVYVPTGARAASAGVWIGQAADVLAMAEQSNLGSSTPVAGGGGEIPSDLRRKAINDAAKSLRAIAVAHGRNGEWAEQAVRRASNLTATEALERNVIDYVAPTLPALLEQLDGKRTQPPKRLPLDTGGAQIEQVEMSAWDRILDTLIDPNIIVLLMSIGTLGIIVELWNPGLIFPGTVGAISLILGLFGLAVLPISWAGVLLMLLAAGFLVAELFIPSHGALTLAGAVSFVLGALMLFNPAGEAYQVSLPVALAVAATMALFMAVVVAKLVQIRRKPVEVGVHSLVGTTGVARRDGFVFANGELWRARSADGELLEPGERVVVEAVDGLVLEVRAARDAERAAADPVS
jgi:membrane-bound serine protease (ClpP class)